MPTTLDARLDSITAQAEALKETAKTENRQFTADEQATFDALIAEAKEVKAAMADHNAAADAIAEMRERPAEPAATAPTGSWGEQFVASAEYRALVDRFGGKLPTGQRIEMSAVRLNGIQAALVTDPGIANPTVRVAPAELAVVDLFSAITVIEDSEQSVKTFTSTWTDAAAKVAEGDVKPEATLTWANVSLTLETIAQHVPVTNQALSHNPTLRSRIDVHLVNGVRAKMQAEVAAVLAAAAGVQVQAFDTDLRTTIRKALTKAQNAAASIGAGPASILISATDAETLDLEALAAATVSNGDGPQQVQTAWRTPLIVSAAIPAGQIYVGDAKQIELFTAGGISVMTGWVNDQFIRNQLTLLGETEAAANVFSAPALVKAATSA